MKQLLTFMFLLVAQIGFGETIKSGQALTLTNEDIGVLTMENKSRLVIDGRVDIGNLNINGSVHIFITHTGVLYLKSSLNMNGLDSVYNSGTLHVLGHVEQQGGKNFLLNYGRITVGGDWQFNDNTSVTQQYSSDTIFVKQSINFNNSAPGSLILNECSIVVSNNVNMDTEYGVRGKGTMFFKYVNLNKRFTDSENIWVLYGGSTVNIPSNWEGVHLNSISNCTQNPLPVVIESTDFKYTVVKEGTTEVEGVNYMIKFTDMSTLQEFTPEESVDNGNTWKQRIAPTIATEKLINTYKGFFRK